MHVNQKSSLKIAKDIVEFNDGERNLDLMSYGVFPIKKKYAACFPGFNDLR